MAAPLSTQGNANSPSLNMLLFRDFLNSNPCLVSSSAAAPPQQFYNKDGSSSSSVHSSSTCCFNANLHHGCGVGGANGTEVAEAVDEDSDFFPRESSDSGLLEEIVHRFLPKSKPAPKNNCESAVLKTEALSVPELFPQPMPDHMVLSSSTQGYDDYTRSGFAKNEGYGVSFDPQIFPMRQFDALNGFSTMQGMPLGNEQFMMMNHAACPTIMEDVFQYPELFNAFAARMQNA